MKNKDNKSYIFKRMDTVIEKFYRDCDNFKEKLSEKTKKEKT